MAKKIAILGGGNLGVAIAQGIVRSGQATASDVIITRRNLSKIASLKKKSLHLHRIT
jgi:pyrroline-5-carboxylate reductase